MGPRGDDWTDGTGREGTKNLIDGTARWRLDGRDKEIRLQGGTTVRDGQERQTPSDKYMVQLQYNRVHVVALTKGD